MIQFCNTLFTRNIGDHVSSPFHYFQWPIGSVHKDSRAYTGGDVVFGGGGLIHPGIDEFLKKAAEDKSCKSIYWGTGVNYHGQSEIVYPEWLKQGTLVGLRDYGNPFHYVPCASCLNPAFIWTTQVPIHSYVFYEHGRIPLQLSNAVGAPILTNYPKERFWAFPKILQFLASGDTVVTNTYHGAYWAMLLGRKVVCVNPVSNRFLGFKYPPVFATHQNWIDMAQSAVAAPSDYLNECRTLNMEFYELVKLQLNTK